MLALRFGSYSMAATVAAISLLSRLKSINLRFLLAPPPRPLTVTFPLARPAFFIKCIIKVFSGFVLVISSKVNWLLNLWDGVSGLKDLIGIVFLLFLFRVPSYWLRFFYNFAILFCFCRFWSKHLNILTRGKPSNGFPAILSFGCFSGTCDSFSFSWLGR